MTPSQIPPRFIRQMGCTHEDMLRWLPTALPGADLDIRPTEKTCVARWGWGTLTIRWAVCPPRQIALLAIPCMDVTFEYRGASDEQRYQTQRRFDLETQRGGG